MKKIFAIMVLSGVGILPAASAQQNGKTENKAAQKADGVPPGNPGPGMVWVDPQSKVYYRSGDSQYGKTKKGTYMSEGDALNSGFHSKNQNPPDTDKKERQK